jgi:predicted GNAT family N-acyltransferase
MAARAGERFRCRIERATSVAQLETVGRLRWEVFSQAIGYGREVAPALCEITGFDVVPEANLFLAYVDGEPIGTLRIVLPSVELADWYGCTLGLPMTLDATIGPVPDRRAVAEIGRSAVSLAYRGSPVIGHLMRAAYLASRAAGITHWVAASLTETDCATDAALIDLLLARRFAPSRFTAIRGPRHAPFEPPRRPFFSQDQRQRAGAGDLSGLALPRSLNFHLLCGAKAAGEAYFDPGIREYLVPIVFDLDEYAASPFGRRFHAPAEEEVGVAPLV